MGIYRGAQQGGISFTLQEGLQDKDIQGKSATMKCSFTLQKDRLFNDRDAFPYFITCTMSSLLTSLPMSSVGM